MKSIVFFCDGKEAIEIAHHMVDCEIQIMIASKEEEHGQNAPLPLVYYGKLEGIEAEIDDGSIPVVDSRVRFKVTN